LGGRLLNFLTPVEVLGEEKSGGTFGPLFVSYGPLSKTVACAKCG
jgi:hypothetical protein